MHRPRPHTPLSLCLAVLMALLAAAALVPTASATDACVSVDSCSADLLAVCATGTCSAYFAVSALGDAYATRDMWSTAVAGGSADGWIAVSGFGTANGHQTVAIFGDAYAHDFSLIAVCVMGDCGGYATFAVSVAGSADCYDGDDTVGLWGKTKVCF